MKKVDEPRAKGQKSTSLLNNYNPPFYLTNAPRCGAKTRRGTPCKGPAMKNGRCRMHGGKSTGPRTPEGLAKSRRANWRHGFYSQEAIKERRFLKNFMETLDEFLQEIE